MDIDGMILKRHLLPVKVYYGAIAMALMGIVNIIFLISNLGVDTFYFLFLYSIPSNTAISFFPHEPIVILFGKSYNPLLIAVICSMATLIAAYLDHTVFVDLLNHGKLAGYKNKPTHKKIAYYFNKCPFLTIVVGGFTPIPFLPIKILSFSCQYPLFRYLMAVVVGRFPRYFLLAAFGEITSAPDWSIYLFTFILLAASAYGWLKPKINQWLMNRNVLEPDSADENIHLEEIIQTGCTHN